MLTLYRALIDLRRQEPALGVGGYEPVDAAGPILAYLRRHRDRRLLIALNLGAEPATLQMPATGDRVLLSTHLDRDEPVKGHSLQLRADEGLIVALAPAERR
jgi:alpha-glucosidase